MSSGTLPNHSINKVLTWLKFLLVEKLFGKHTVLCKPKNLSICSSLLFLFYTLFAKTRKIDSIKILLTALLSFRNEN